MLRRPIPVDKKAQSFLEYTIVVGAIVLIIFAMNALLKRGTQAMIKVVADEIGSQQNADQRFDDSGFLVSSYTSTRATADKTRKELNGVVTYIFGDQSQTATTAIINLGFTNEN